MQVGTNEPLRSQSILACNYGQEVHSLADQLQEKGYTVASVDSSLENIASQNNTRPFVILSALSNEGHQ